MILLDSNIFNGRFGLERETLRVDKNGRMSKTPHPFESKNLSRDFCENQLEIITPVCESIDGAVQSLSELSGQAEKELNKKGEFLWRNSNPPYIENEDEIPIAKFDGDESSKQSYRRYLERKYGKRIMLYSGIHFNMSFDESLLDGDKDAFYMRLLRQSARYSWLLVLLTAASPLYDRSFEKDGQSGSAFGGFSSMRSGNMGYWNNFVPILDYTDLKSYCKSIRNYIQKGLLISAGELYLPVRIKPAGQNSLETLEAKGADHIELRMFDINPLSPVGVFTEDLKFAHLFLLYLSSLPDFEFTAQMQEKAVQNHKNAAVFDLTEVEIEGENIIQAAKRIIKDMKKYFSESEKFVEIEGIIDYQLDKLNGSNRYADKIFHIYQEDFHGRMTDNAVKGGELYV